MESASDRQIERGRADGLSRVCFWSALALGCACITSQSLWIDRTFIEPTRGQSTASSAQGRAAPSFYVDFDGYYFVSYAREMIASSRARIRWTWLDDTPSGRPVHWSSLFPWWLIGIGSLHAALTDTPLHDAIAAAAYYANPLLFGITIALAGAVLRRRFGAPIAAASILVLATHPRLLEDFAFAKPDHHGLQIGFALATLLCAVVAGAGWVAHPEPRSGASRRLLPPSSARRWMRASGICGGVGLWIGATQLGVVIASVGIGGALAGWLGGRSRSNDRGGDHYRPELWRSWARAGAATSLAAYAIEYLPAGSGMRLEVNHPLYALTWLCGGEIVSRIARWRSLGAALSMRERWFGIALLAGGLLLPAAVAWGPPDWYLPRDAYLLNLHSRIDEFLPHFASGPSWLESLAFLGLPALGAVSGTIALAIRRGSAAETGCALVALAPCWVLAPWVLLQTRWLGLFVAAGVCALAVTLELGMAAERRSRRARALGWPLWAALGLGLAIGLGAIGSRYFEDSAPTGRPALPVDLYLRELALRLCPTDAGPVRLMTGPGEAARIHFFGSCRGVGTPYWENLAGLRATADFFATENASEAREILRDHKIDYVLIANGVPFIEYMRTIREGDRAETNVRETLGHRLIAVSSPPAWLETVRIRDWPGHQVWRLFRVIGN